MDALTLLDKIYIAFAVIGGALFVTRLVLMIAGMGHDVDASADAHIDVHVDAHGDAGHGDGADHGDTDVKLLTLQGITGFCLIFGVTGFVLHHLAGTGGLIASAAASAAGILTFWLTAVLLRLLLKLQSSGTIDIRNAMGKEGKVYLHIPPGGVGKVQIEIQGRLEIYDAVSNCKDTIQTGESVLVIFIKGNQLMVDRY